MPDKTSALKAKAENLKREARRLFAKADQAKREGKLETYKNLRILAAKTMKEGVAILSIWVKP